MALKKQVISCFTALLALPWVTWAVAYEAIPSGDHSLRIFLIDADKRVVSDAIVGVVTADGTWAVAEAQPDGTYSVTGLWTKTVLDIDHPLYDGGDIALNLPPQPLSSVYIQLVDGLAARVNVRGVAEVSAYAEFPNDFCEGAIEVGCDSTTTFDNTAATTDATEPPFSCHFGGPAQGVNNMWFTFVATDTTAFLDTNNSAVSDTLLAVYDGTCGNLVEIACSEDEGVGLLSEVCVRGLTVGNTYYVQVGSFSASSVGEITLNIQCPCVLAPSMDIKPGSCPNSYNRSSRGVLPVGLLGTDDFDVTHVDTSSLLLFRADGVGGAVAPHEGPPGPHTVFADVGTPFEGESCDCHELEGDDLLDLSMKFETDEVVSALELSDLSPGALVELMLTGTLLDGTPFEATDCVRLVPPGTPPGELVVASSMPDVWIDSSPLDLQLDGGGFTDFQRTYPAGTVVTLTAPDLVNGRPFKRWVVDGVLQPAGVKTIEVTIVEGLMSVDLELRWSPPNIAPRDNLAPDRLLAP